MTHATPTTRTAASTPACSAPTTTQWAFGTDFEDPLAGVDTTVPAGLDAAELAAYCLSLGDDALVMSHRLSEWCSNAPDLEDDIALANIALDLLGQARLLLARAAAADPSVVPALPEGSPVPAEDALAFFREALRLPQRPAGRGPQRRLRPHGRAGAAVLDGPARGVRAPRVGSAHHGADPVLAAIAAKGVKELAYHRDYAARWFVTLAQGHRGVAAPAARRADRGLAAVRRAARRPTTSAPRSDVVLDQVFAVARGGATRGRRRCPAAATPRRCPGCSPRCRSSPGRTRWVLVVSTAYAVAASVTDPEMPMLTLEDLGVLRDVREDHGQVVVTITPTYSGCPAMATMRDDLVHRLSRRRVRRARGRLAEPRPGRRLDHRARPGRPARARAVRARARRRGVPARSRSTCCRPGASSPAPGAAPAARELTSEFGATACKALYRCADCLEPFEHVKEH